MRLKKFINTLNEFELNNLFSYTNDMYREKNIKHVASVWIYTASCLLKNKGYSIVKTENVEAIPNPYRSALREGEL